jgi:hypothetical protein
VLSAAHDGDAVAIALYEAWKVNKAAPFSVSGPFAVGPERFARDG